MSDKEEVLPEVSLLRVDESASLSASLEQPVHSGSFSVDAAATSAHSNGFTAEPRYDVVVVAAENEEENEVTDCDAVVVVDVVNHHHEDPLSAEDSAVADNPSSGTDDGKTEEELITSEVLGVNCDNDRVDIAKDNELNEAVDSANFVVPASEEESVEVATTTSLPSYVSNGPNATDDETTAIKFIDLQTAGTEDEKASIAAEVKEVDCGDSVNGVKVTKSEDLSETQDDTKYYVDPNREEEALIDMTMSSSPSNVSSTAAEGMKLNGDAAKTEAVVAEDFDSIIGAYKAVEAKDDVPIDKEKSAIEPAESLLSSSSITEIEATKTKEVVLIETARAADSASSGDANDVFHANGDVKPCAALAESLSNQSLCAEVEATKTSEQSVGVADCMSTARAKEVDETEDDAAVANDRQSIGSAKPLTSPTSEFEATETTDEAALETVVPPDSGSRVGANEKDAMNLYFSVTEEMHSIESEESCRSPINEVEASKTCDEAEVKTVVAPESENLGGTDKANENGDGVPVAGENQSAKFLSSSFDDIEATKTSEGAVTKPAFEAESHSESYERVDTSDSFTVAEAKQNIDPTKSLSSPSPISEVEEMGKNADNVATRAGAPDGEGTDKPHEADEFTGNDDVVDHADLEKDPYVNLGSHQRSPINANEHEQQNLQAFASPVGENAPAKVAFEEGTVSPYADFVSQQSAQIKQFKEKEREARQLLSRPASGTPRKLNNEPGTVSPFADFVLHQSAQIKEGREKEREARQSLNSPAQVRQKPRVSMTPEAGAVAPYADFVTQQCAQIKQSKEKEREARRSLNMPAKVSLSPSSSAIINEAGVGLAPYAAFVTQQSAQIKSTREKEREARQMMNRPQSNTVVVMASDQHLVDLRAMDVEQKRRQTEAQELNASYRMIDPESPGDMQSQMAAELKLQQEEHKRKRKEAEELVSAYRQTDSNLRDSQSRMAAEIKQQDQEQRHKKKEAEELATNYRLNLLSSGDTQHRFAAELKLNEQQQKQRKKEAEELVAAYRPDLSSGDAALRTAAEVQSFKEKQTRKKREAEELASSYRYVNLSGDCAASQTAAQLSTLKVEQRQRKKEAEALAQSYRCGSLDAGSAYDRVAAELKRQQDDEKKKKKEAQAMNAGYRITAEDVQPKTAAAAALEFERKQKSTDSVIDVVDSSPRSLDDFKARMAEELQMLGEGRKKRESEFDDENRLGTPSNLENLKLRTTDELTSMQNNGSTKVILEELSRGNLNNSLEKVKCRAKEELLALQESSSSLKSRTEEFNRGMTSDSIEKVKSKTEKELSVLKTACTTRNLTEEFDRGIKSKNLENLKSRKAEELPSLQEKATNLHELAEEFDRGITSVHLEEMKSRRADELACLHEKGSSLQELTEGFERGITSGNLEKVKMRTAGELTSLQGKGSNLHDLAEEFSRSADKTSCLEKMKWHTADELASLRGQGTSMRDLTREFSQGTVMNNSFDNLKSQTESELAALKGNGSVNDRMQRFSRGITSPNVKKLKLQTANELENLKGKISLRDKMQKISRGSNSPNTEKLKLQSELADMQIGKGSLKDLTEQWNKQEIEEDAIDQSKNKAPIFTETELAAFEEERKLKERELEGLKEFSSKKKLDSLRSSTAAELREISQRRRMGAEN